jgi:TPR repeat protein
MQGEDVERSHKRREAEHQLRLAEQGDAAAQNIIGAKLATGYFMKTDLAGALYWYAKAVKQGYTHAKFNAGTMLIAGEGVGAAHFELGMKLIEEAAECGDPSACQFLSLAGAARKPQHFSEYGSPHDLEAHGISLSRPRIEWA